MRTIETCPNCGLEVAFDEAMRHTTLCPRCESPVASRAVNSSPSAHVSFVPVPGTTPGATIIPLGRGVHTIGRKSAKSTASVQIDVHDLFMSKRHTQVNVTEQYGSPVRVEVRDAGSSNGTFVNERRLAPLEEVQLSAGDRLRMGNTVFTVVIK